MISTRTLPLPLALLLGAACTFPEVDYAGSGGGGTTTAAGAGGTAGSDGGGDAPVDSPCQLPQKCVTETSACTKKAQGEQKSCKNKCKPPELAACEMSCDAQLAADLEGCASQCVSCAEAEGCAMQQTACAALAGT